MTNLNISCTNGEDKEKNAEKHRIETDRKTLGKSGCPMQKGGDKEQLGMKERHKHGRLDGCPQLLAAMQDISVS